MIDKTDSDVGLRRALLHRGLLSGVKAPPASVSGEEDHPDGEFGRQ
jgi:hypothetical protein